MKPLLKDQCAVITGAGSERGIGFATAQLFAAHGARVALLDINGADAVQAAARLGAQHIGVEADVRDAGACKAAVKKVIATFSRIDILINNAGVTQSSQLLELTAADYDFVMDVNMRGGVHMSQAVLPSMQHQRHGSIVFMSSVTAQRGGGVFGGPHYGAAKAAVIGLAKSMAREFGPAGIRVNAVAPGVIDTDITKGRRTLEQRLGSVKGAPIERLGTAVEVANACLFLASELSSYTTGFVVDVNGGMHIH